MDRETSVQRLMLCVHGNMRRSMMQYVSAYMHDTSLKPQYLVFLFYIRDNDGISQKELNEFASFDKSYISIVVRELIEKGLVVNTGTGKTYSLHLTDHGRDLAFACDMIVDMVDEKLFGNFTEEELQMFLHCLKKLNANVELLDAEVSSRKTDS